MSSYEKFLPAGELRHLLEFDQQALDRQAAIGCKLGAFVATVCSTTDRVLLVQLGDYAIRKIGGNPWTLPGGSVDYDESPSNAVLRELREETSVQVSKRDLFPAAWIIRPYAGTSENPGEITLVYLGLVSDEKKPVFYPPEIIGADWFEFDLKNWLSVRSTGQGARLQPLRRHWIYWTDIAMKRRHTDTVSRVLYAEPKDMQLAPNLV
ncbi:MAG: NUDIX hydrolase [Planctomycetota bacterium]